MQIRLSKAEREIARSYASAAQAEKRSLAFFNVRQIVRSTPPALGWPAWRTLSARAGQ